MKLIQNIKRNLPNFLGNSWRFSSVQLQRYRERLHCPAFFGVEQCAQLITKANTGKLQACVDKARDELTARLQFRQCGTEMGDRRLDIATLGFERREK